MRSFFQNGGGNAFSYTSQGTAGQPGGSATLSTTNTALFFAYSSIAGLPADLSGIQGAHLTFTSFTTLGPTSVGSVFSNIFDGSGVNSAMLTITRDTPAAEGTGSRTILLQVIFTPFTFNGTGGGAGFSASSLSGTVTFSSDFLDFSNAIERDVGLSFSSLSPGLGLARMVSFLTSPRRAPGRSPRIPCPFSSRNPAPTRCWLARLDLA